MADKSDDKINENGILNDLVKAARDDSRDRFVRPSKVSIEAYLLGTATETQKKEVTRALIQSAEFRRELLDMAKDLESLTDVQTVDEFGKVQVPPVPSLESLVKGAHKQTPAKKSAWSTVRRLVVFPRLSQPLQSFLEFFKGRHLPRMATAGLAGVVLIVFVSILLVKFARDRADELTVASWSTEEVMDAGLFVSNVPRMPDSELATVTLHATHREAAESEFMRVIRYENGKYILQSEAATMAPPDQAKRVLLRFIDESGNSLEEFHAIIPRGTHKAFPQVRAWVIAIPSRQLHNFELQSDSTVAIWTSEMGLRGCVTFTYEVDGKYTASPGLSFGF